MRLMREMGKRFLVATRVPLTHRTPDRTVLEKSILPWLAGQPGLQRVLFVGCDWYTSKYNRTFARHEYSTMDIDPVKRRYGSKRHIVDSMSGIGGHFAPRSLDLVICNGVYGWGLNDREEIDHAFASTWDCLRPGGMFLLGWNDIAPHNEVPLRDIPALGRFESATITPLGTTSARIDSPNNHVYSCYRRPETSPAVL